MSSKLHETLDECFYSYRAEWLESSLGSLFVRPTYYNQLESDRPCFIVGGRGTGKTTALRWLRFDAASEPRGYAGVFIRVNKNQAHSFRSDRNSELLRKAFTHYFNLLGADELCSLASWLEEHDGGELAAADVERISEILCLERRTTLDDLAAAIQSAIRKLEVFVNNVDDPRAESPLFSPPESPIRNFAEVIAARDPRRRRILCCIDEYENLLPAQQSILNAYVKHAEPPLSYKIGLKTNGLRSTDTLEPGDPLVTPADYVEINLTSATSEGFLRDVLQRRIDVARERGAALPSTPEDLLPSLTRTEEAILLGAAPVSERLRRDLRSATGGIADWVSSVPNGDLYFLAYWAQATESSELDLAASYSTDPRTWANLLNNHGFASLFWLSKGRKGARIRKYYSGLRTLFLLANGNVRFFLDLVGSAIQRVEEENPGQELIAEPKIQTEAARAVGRRQLEQLDRLGPRGGDLKRLVLAVGKVFFELSRRPQGRAPEPTSFVLSGSAEAVAKAHQLLREGVVHLAFEVSPRTKATSETEMRDDEYRLHPIFAPFFEMSYRRKRRITIDADAIERLLIGP